MPASSSRISRRSPATGNSPRTRRSSPGSGASAAGAIAVIGQEKGNDTESRLKHNFGMARPEGYRKAVRVMELADRFSLPVVALVDTAGAYPGHRRGGARPGRGDRPLDRGVPEARRAQRRRHHRRGRLGRRRRHRHRQQGADARALDLYRHLAGGVRLDPLARFQPGPGRGDQHEDHGAGPRRASASSTGSSRSRSAAPIASRRRRSRRPATRSRRPLPPLTTCRPRRSAASAAKSISPSAARFDNFAGLKRCLACQASARRNWPAACGGNRLVKVDRPRICCVPGGVP